MAYLVADCAYYWTVTSVVAELAADFAVWLSVWTLEILVSPVVAALA